MSKPRAPTINQTAVNYDTTGGGGGGGYGIVNQSNNSNQQSAYQIQNVQNYIKELEISEGQLSSCLRYD